MLMMLPASGPRHLPPEDLRRQNRASEKVQIHHLPQSVGAQIEEAFGLHDRRVRAVAPHGVDQHIHTAEVPHDAPRQIPHRLRIRCVRGVAVRLDA
jgi:hypothetical protein